MRPLLGIFRHDFLNQIRRSLALMCDLLRYMRYISSNVFIDYHKVKSSFAFIRGQKSSWYKKPPEDYLY